MPRPVIAGRERGLKLLIWDGLARSG